MSEDLQTFINHILNLLNISQGFLNNLQFFFNITGVQPGRKKSPWSTRTEKFAIILVQLYLSVTNSKLCHRAHTSWGRSGPEHNVCP
jgi:hypothetical protein